jgi:hypothetical protein
MPVGNFSSNTPGVPAVTANATAATGPGSNGVYGVTSSAADSAVYGEHRGTGIGIFGRGGPNGGEGIFGQTANGFSGVYGKNQNTIVPSTNPNNNRAIGNPGLTGESSSGTGVIGISHLAAGLVGDNYHEGGAGVFGSCDELRGVGVLGEADGVKGVGVWGESLDGPGVVGVGHAYHSAGVTGRSQNIGVYAHNDSAKEGNDAYLGAGGFAGDFHGHVSVLGKIHKFGGGFRIDHPLDPATKYLSHSFVESSDMKNIYDGIAVLDSGGEAEVELPSWFDALNTDFRYQLTCIGGYAPVYIAHEVQDNRFKIAGGASGLKVSWQVTGIRHDHWANANRSPVEEEKPANEQGYYLAPELYGESDERHIRQVRYPEQMQWIESVKDLAQ